MSRPFFTFFAFLLIIQFCQSVPGGYSKVSFNIYPKSVRTNSHRQKDKLTVTYQVKHPDAVSPRYSGSSSLNNYNKAGPFVVRNQPSPPKPFISKPFVPKPLISNSIVPQTHNNNQNVQNQKKTNSIYVSTNSKTGPAVVRVSGHQQSFSEVAGQKPLTFAPQNGKAHQNQQMQNQHIMQNQDQNAEFNLADAFDDSLPINFY